MLNIHEEGDFSQFLGDNQIKYKELKGIEDNEGLYVEESTYLTNSDSSEELVSKLRIFNNNILEHEIKNSIGVRVTKEGVQVGDKLLKDMSIYMYRMFHPKYRSYKQLLDYLEHRGKEMK